MTHNRPSITIALVGLLAAISSCSARAQPNAVRDAKTGAPDPGKGIMQDYYPHEVVKGGAPPKASKGRGLMEEEGISYRTKPAGTPKSR